MDLYVGYMMVVLGLVSFMSMRKHVLMMLLSIEFIMLGFFYLMCLSVMNFFGEIYFFLVFLSFVACEGALGLSIVVLLSRTYGNEYLVNLNMLKC